MRASSLVSYQPDYRWVRMLSKLIPWIARIWGIVGSVVNIKPNRNLNSLASLQLVFARTLSLQPRF